MNHNATAEHDPPTEPTNTPPPEPYPNHRATAEHDPPTKPTNTPPPQPSPNHNATAERGSVLLLFPAAVLVMVVLAALVIDIGFTRVRTLELRAVAASAANDVLGALDTDALRSTGLVSFDAAAAERLVNAAIANGPLPHADLEAVTITRNRQNRWEIAVTVSIEIDPVIAPALTDGYRNLKATVTERALIVG